MTNQEPPTNLRLRMSGTRYAAVLVIVFSLAVVAAPPAGAQTYTVLHNFIDGSDGAFPYAGLTIDAAGSLYGTAFYGGSACNNPGCGTVFKLAHKGAGWIFNPIYSFPGGDDGADPGTRVIFGPGGSLYGTTAYGGTGQNCQGTVFSLRPPPRACLTALCPWTETVLHSFCANGSNDGLNPNDIAFDQAGDIYGTTSQGGRLSRGVIYELKPSSGSWTESLLHQFDGASNFTLAGVTLDQANNLYGTAPQNPYGWVYELTASGEFLVLHDFNHSNGGDGPIGGLIFDSSGNLYGSTVCGDASGSYGTVFEMSQANGSWTLTTINNLPGSGADCGGPVRSMVMDAAGNLYGTTYYGGAYDYGSVFKLTPSNGSWTYTSLHDFCAGGYPCSDGSYPYSNVVVDSEGNLYGTASQGGTCPSHGTFSCGVVWEITP